MYIIAHEEIYFFMYIYIYIYIYMYMYVYIYIYMMYVFLKDAKSFPEAMFLVCESKVV